MGERFCVAPPSSSDGALVEVPNLRTPSLPSMDTSDGPEIQRGGESSEAVAAAGLFLYLLGVLSIALGAVIIVFFG